jgi:hypothetical protein
MFPGIPESWMPNPLMNTKKPAKFNNSSTSILTLTMTRLITKSWSSIVCAKRSKPWWNDMFHVTITYVHTSVYPCQTCEEDVWEYHPVVSCYNSSTIQASFQVAFSCCKHALP